MSTPSILVIDDSSEDIDLMRLLLGHAGFTVESASNGVEGLERLADHLPDLVILNFMMPRMNGDEVLQRMRADPLMASIPVIVATCYPPGMEACRPLADIVLLKPLELDSFLAEVRRLAGHGRSG